MKKRISTGGPASGVAIAVAALVVSAIGVASAPASDGAGAASGRGHPRLLASDTGANPNPVPFWGAVECESASRHALVPVGGDPHPTATGQPQNNTSYHRMTVLDGDDFYGARCELGLDNRAGPTAFYREGRRRTTAISLRLPQGFPLKSPAWKVVMQMKQANPAANTSGSPMLELEAFQGRWKLIGSRKRGLTSDSRELWSAPAQTGVWTRFNFKIRYSRSPRKGWIKVAVDLNGDGDSLDPGERRHKIRTFTLKTEVRGGRPDGVRPGASIPSHLRTGLYQDPAIPCPPPAGCSVDVDNVQVLAP
jgi:Polysaccharide lyase